MRNIIITIIAFISFVACSADHKSGYEISDLYHSSNPDILKAVENVYRDECHMLFEVELVGSHLCSGRTNEMYGTNGQSLHYNEDHSHNNLFDVPKEISLDGLYFANTGEKLKRGDITFLCYSEKEKHFYFVKPDFSKPLEDQKCYCDKTENKYE